MAQLYFDDEEFGRICIRMRRGSTRMSARWSKGMVTLIVPYAYGMTGEAVKKFIDSCRPWLRSHRPQTPLGPGRRIDLGEGCYYAIVSDPGASGLTARLSADRKGVIVTVGGDFTSGPAELETRISEFLLNTSPHFSEPLLLTPLRCEAARLGLRPRSVSVSHGRRTLGTCSSMGDIRISKACVFLTPELRRYIFCHELAHLTHHDHSPSFHSLLDRYLDGREAEMIRKLHAYQWPILR
ncbi:MAG: M48 family metallopeptidase [Duncaniella sp.]|nr:M48 family metallopeptidase [Duncaniella sp.]